MQELFTLSFFVSFWQDTPQQKSKGKKSRKGAVRTLHSYLLLPFMSISDDVDTGNDSSESFGVTGNNFFGISGDDVGRGNS